MRAQYNLDYLLLKNQEYIMDYEQSGSFSIFNDETLKTPKKRKAFFLSLGIFSQYFQTMIFSRQATCVSERYQTIFLKHFREELGHDEYLPANGASNVNDAALIALSSWFSHQMFIRDNVEKALIVHFVLEPAGDSYHRAAAKVLAHKECGGYFDLHAEVDQGHQEMGIPLLQGHTDETYSDLLALLAVSWDVMTQAVERIAYIAHHARG